MAQMTKTLDRPESAYARLVALAAFACCIVALVSGLIPQAEMALLGGNVVIGNALAKGLLLVCLLIISFLNPKLKINEPFLVWWLLLVLFLIFEIGFLSLASDIPLWNVLGAYNGDYLLPLIGVPFFLFGGNISEKTTIRVITLIFLACAIIGLAQHLTNEPLL